jgi:hypothetical protein
MRRLTKLLEDHGTPRPTQDMACAQFATGEAVNEALGYM